MKLKTTKKDIKNHYNTILKVGYCNIQTLLKGQDAFAYSCGVYGWSCDYYDIDGVCISTGYNPIGEQVDFDLCRQFEQKAKEVKYNTWEQYKQDLNILLDNFIKKALENIKK